MSFFTLKTIALLSMLWDHAAYVWQLPLPGAFDYIGRIAAPVFAFMIANGYRHTKNWKRYALRLLLFACLAEWPYYLLFGFHGNIMFTLCLGLLTLRLFDWGNEKRPWLGWMLAALVIAAEWHLGLFEGGGSYLLFILLFDLTDHWSFRAKALLWLVVMPLSRYRLAWMLISDGLLTSRYLHMLSLNALGPLLGVGLVLCYNGEKGPSVPGLKYLWYIFYPAHLLVLVLIRWGMVQ